MIEVLPISSFFLLGLLCGLGHCVAMCSPFVFWFAGTLSAQHRVEHTLRTQLLYNLGRSLTYAGLGALAGLLGGALELGGALFGVGRAAAILAGVLLVIYAGGAFVGYLPLENLARLDRLKRGIAALLQQPPRRPFLIGLLLGFLPCGPLYGALIASAALGAPHLSALAMALFALGTWPAMLGLALLGRLLSRHRGLLHKLSITVILGLGFFFIWQGISS